MVPLESRWTSTQSWFWWFPSSICTHLIWCMVMWTGAQNYRCQDSCSIETRELCVHIWICACSTIACFCLENDNEQTIPGNFGSTQLKCMSLPHMVCRKTLGQTQKVECFCFHWPSTAVDCTVVACYSNYDFFFLKNLETWNEICLQCFQGQIINPEVIDDRVLINPVESFDQSLY